MLSIPCGFKHAMSLMPTAVLITGVAILVRNLFITTFLNSL